MSPESQRARRADAERNRAALLTAAARLFDERGTDIALDEVAKRAGVANATLYRHFATRTELIIAVYADEVAELRALGDQLAGSADPDRALTAWLRAFVHHVATRRDLAMAIPDHPDTARATLFDQWHATMHDAAGALLARAQSAGLVRRTLHTGDLLALTAGIALTGLPASRLDALLDVVGDGYRVR